MAPPEPSHGVVALIIVGIPVLATFIMELAESLVETLGWRIRLMRTGWDLCVLSVGCAGGIFTLPGVLSQWGPVETIIAGLIVVFVSIGCGIVVIHIRKTEPRAVKGWQSLVAVGLGIASLTLPVYFIMRS
jgi:hypothetical protein